MKEIVAFSRGFHILKQEFLEILISFILSCRNTINGVIKSVNTLCEKYGEKIVYKDYIYFTFPDIKILKKISIEEMEEMEEMEEIKFGYRAKFINETCQKLSDNCNSLNYSREELLSLPGVGNKVADCVMLHSNQNRTVFPVDIWISRIMQNIFSISSNKYNVISTFGQERFGNLASYAEVLLFYYSRKNIKGV